MGTSLISAFIAAQVGQLQLAVAARLLKTNSETGSSVTQLINAAQKNFDPLGNVPVGLGTNLDVSA
jgi:hypothetical protein